MKDNEIKKALQSVDKITDTNVAVPDMQPQIAELSAKATLLNHKKKEKIMENKRIQTSPSRSMRTRFLAISLSCVLVIGGVLGLGFGWGWFGKDLKVKPNWEWAAIARERAKTAQYLPTAEKLVGTNIQGISPQSFQVSMVMPLASNNEFTIEDYNKLVDEIGAIDSPYNREYKVNDVRIEAIKAFEFGIFDKWFYSGQIEYQTGNAMSYAYKLNYNEKTGRISLLSRDGFQPWIYDKATGQNKWNGDYTGYGTNQPISEAILKKIDYYTENGKEIVECEIFSILEHFDRTTVTQYQYLKNIKDTSFTKYVITPSIYVSVGLENGAWGYDIDSNNLNGTKRQFIQIDYSDEDDFYLTSIEQTFPAEYYYDKIQTSVLVKNLKTDVKLYSASFNEGHLPEVYTLYGDGTLYPNSSSDMHEIVNDQFLIMLTNLKISANVKNLIIQMGNTTIQDQDLFMRELLEVLDSATTEIRQNSFLANNYDKGEKIKETQIISDKDVEDSTPPNFEAL